MAISETTLKDTVLFLIDEQNKKGGVLGKKLEAVVVIRLELAAVRRKGTRADHKDKVSVYSAAGPRCRASRAPGVQGAELDLFYPCSTRARRASATCSTPVPRRQQRSLRSTISPRREGEALGAGRHDYVYPRTTNKILEAYLKSKASSRKTS